jgi:superfamily II DNA/RNA helicase
MSVERNNKNDITIPDDNSIIPEKETQITIFNTWDELELRPDLLRGIYAYGFEKPSPIQSKAIKLLLLLLVYYLELI